MVELTSKGCLVCLCSGHSCGSCEACCHESGGQHAALRKQADVVGVAAGGPTGAAAPAKQQLCSQNRNRTAHGCSMRCRALCCHIACDAVTFWHGSHSFEIYHTDYKSLCAVTRVGQRRDCREWCFHRTCMCLER